VLAATVGFVTFALLLPGPRSGSTAGSGVTCVTYLGWVEPLGPFSCHRTAAAAAGALTWLVARQLLRWRQAEDTRRLLMAGVALLGIAAVAAFAPALLAPDRRAFVGGWTGPDGTPAETGKGAQQRYAVLSYEGPEHCAWETAVFLQVAWPVGSMQSNRSDADRRTFIRDPEGAVSQVRLAGELTLDSTLPPGSTDTGYERGEVSLWLGPDGGDRFVYVVQDGAVERWPRALQLPGCA